MRTNTPSERGKGSTYLAGARVIELTKELEQKVEEMSKIEQASYDLGQKETEAHLKSQIWL